MFTYVGHLKEFIEVMMMFFVVIILNRTFVDGVNVVPVLELINFPNIFFFLHLFLIIYY